MHFVYIDDSGNEKYSVFSALVIPADDWQKAFELIKNYRRELKEKDGLFIYKELHATDFVAGKGRVSNKVITKFRRAQIYKETLTFITTLPNVSLFNCVFNHGQDQIAFERLLNRLNRTMEAKKSRALLFSDKGKESTYNRLRRKMGIINHIPSRFGQWPSGTGTRNIPLDRILEDICFKDSKQSYFIQLADFCAYALLRREHPLDSKKKYELEKAFNLLQQILFLKASSKDTEGIIRP